VTITSHHYFARVFLDFLNDSRTVLKSATPEDRLNQIWQCLTAWQLEDDIVTVKTPARTFSVVSDTTYLTFSHFDPGFWLGANQDFDEIWRSLMTNAGVLLVGPTPEHVSNAVFSLFSLVSPLQYRDPALVYTRLGDPRFADVINGATVWKIVGTTNILALETCRQFRTVVKLPLLVNRSASDVRKTPTERTRRLLGRFESALNSLLDQDPYSDFLGTKLTHDELSGIGSRKSKTKQLSDREAGKFQNSLTFAGWQSAIAFRDDLRDALLSSAPQDVVADRSPEALAVIEQTIPMLLHKFGGDRHVCAVLNRQMHWLKRERRAMQREPEPDS
jgi:hypothetical protein